MRFEVTGRKSSLYSIWARGYETFFMLNSTEHELKTKMLKIKTFLAFKLSDVLFIMLINVNKGRQCCMSESMTPLNVLFCR